MRRVEFTVPGDLWGVSPNFSTKKPAYRRALQREWKQKAWLCWAGSGSPSFTVPVNLTLIVRRVRSMDLQNAIAAAKWLVDGVTGPGLLIPDDGVRWVKSIAVEFETGQRYKLRPEVVVICEEAQ